MKINYKVPKYQRTTLSLDEINECLATLNDLLVQKSNIFRHL